MIELNKIYCESNIQTTQRITNDFIDLVITSPPYDNLRNYNGYDFEFELLAKELFRIVKLGGIVVWIVADATINGSETGTSFKQALYFMKIGFNLHDTMIWYKRTIPINGKRYDNAFEYMFVLSKGKPKTFNPIKVHRLFIDNRKIKEGQRAKSGERSFRKNNSSEFVNDINVWDIPTGLEKDNGHPAIFPLKLAQDHIFTWSNENDIVYDPFIGSGTTAIASLELKRNWIGSEISEEYYDIANKRLQPYLAQQKLF